LLNCEYGLKIMKLFTQHVVNLVKF
jgi:hypothetical protein